MSKRFRFSSKPFGQIQNHLGPREGPDICLQICSYNILTGCPKLVSIQFWQFLTKIGSFVEFVKKPVTVFVNKASVKRSGPNMFLFSYCTV